MIVGNEHKFLVNQPFLKLGSLGVAESSVKELGQVVLGFDMLLLDEVSSHDVKRLSKGLISFTMSKTTRNPSPFAEIRKISYRELALWL